MSGNTEHEKPSDYLPQTIANTSPCISGYPKNVVDQSLNHGPKLSPGYHGLLNNKGLPPAAFPVRERIDWVIEAHIVHKLLDPGREELLGIYHYRMVSVDP